MLHFGAKYLLALAVVIIFFGSAVACGTQLYQVSIKDDVDDRLPESSPSKDPASPSYGIHAPNGWATLPIRVSFGERVNQGQKEALVTAMKQWEQAVGRRLFEVVGSQAGVDGDSFDDLYSSLKDDINGQYLDNNWTKTSKPAHVLATTIWDSSLKAGAIAKADIRFNTQYYLIGDSLLLTSVDNKEVVDMQSLALHEIGHLLGLSHIEPQVDKYSIMNPALFIGEGLTSRDLSRDDIKRIQQIYGCDGLSCDIDALLAQQSQALTTAKQAAEKTKSSKAPASAKAGNTTNKTETPTAH